MTPLAPPPADAATIIAPGHRLRRLRTSPAMRALVRETGLEPGRPVAPLFVHERRSSEPIPRLPGQSRLDVAAVLDTARQLAALGVGGVLLFGIPDGKDPEGRAAADPDSPVATALRALRAERLPLALAADVCLCEYTTHGHCGVPDGDRIANDASLPRLADAAVAYASKHASGLYGPFLELLTAMALAGADLLITYLAADAARWLETPDA